MRLPNVLAIMASGVNGMRAILSVMLSMCVCTEIVAQGPTLRERVARAGGDIEVTITGDGTVPTLSEVLVGTDIVVRASLGKSSASLSRDERNITTTYELSNQRILFSALPAQATRPGMIPRALTLTLPGGTVSIGAFTATVTYDDVPKLRPGMEVVALLRDVQGTFELAQRNGVFEIRDGRVVPLTRQASDGKKYEGVAADTFATQIVAMRKQLKR